MGKKNKERSPVEERSYTGRKRKHENRVKSLKVGHWGHGYILHPAQEWLVFKNLMWELYGMFRRVRESLVRLCTVILFNQA